jgi:hypothetical protein
MRILVRHCVTLFGVFAILALTSGCVTPAQSLPPAQAVASVARVEVVNLSDCDWHIAIALPDGREIRTADLLAHDALRLAVPSGDFAITQTALNGVAGPAAVRHFPAHLEPGASYRWRLATLLTGQTGATP